MSLLKNFIYEEEGMGTIEIAILIAALVALAIVFRKQLAGLWTKASGGMTKNDAEMSSPNADFELAEPTPADT